jgi:outer membrane receptor for ferrienterochelin and colicin
MIMASFRARLWFAVVAVSLAALPAAATVFGSVRGLVHDPQHRPVAGAKLTLRAASADWSRTTVSNGLGEFLFDAVPAGEYFVSVDAVGFRANERRVEVIPSGAAEVHIPLDIAQANQTVEVSAEVPPVDTQSSSSSTVIDRQAITATPGAERSNSLAMVTNYVPGAVMVHDQLHLRGGHQVSWLVDGVPVPNTNIASNVGPQFDPKDIDELDVQRGGYSAEYGDRIYGVFNVVTRSGFERNRQGEFVASYGNFNTTDDQLSFGSHSERFAYYASVNANRTDLGLQTPSTTVLHDLGSGAGGFLSLIFNRDPADQMRLITSLRADHYQAPNTPEQQAAGIRDVENERDAFVNFTWAHSLGHGDLLTVSPFYHFNRAHYLGGPNDVPVVPEDDRGSNYAGGVVTLGALAGRHNAHFGLQGFAQRDNEFFGLRQSAASIFAQRQVLSGSLISAFLEDQYRLTNWFTLNSGLRVTRFAGARGESALDPRIGGALTIPRLGWVLRAFYGRYYQAPPLLTLSGPLLELASAQGLGFLPLRGEKDEQHEFGLTLPVKGWTVDVDQFRTAARNYFDHDVLGNSNIFFPVTLERARIRGWEASARSPKLARRLDWHLAYAHMYAEGRGGVSGGLTDFAPPESGAYYFLDHDQRDVLSTGVRVSLPWQAWTAVNVGYGSGFLNGDGPAHLPAHATADLSLGKSFGESWSAGFSALNFTNHRCLLDNSNTFGGTHYAYPIQVSLQLKYRFRY